MSLPAGTRLGPYEILGPLGAGGMGEVYRARDTRLDRLVAIKVLPDHLSGKPAARDRFDREARAISSLSHPNICALFDVGAAGEVDFLVMEFLEGETLADRLARGPLPFELALRHGLEICRGLEAAHRAGVVHRDLKPGNIMLTKGGAKLLDFGLAKPSMAVPGSSSELLTRTRALTAEGTLVGTFQYMSPEQIEGGEVDHRSDLFALGAVLYEMVAGKRAFEGKSQLSVASAILEREPEPITQVRPSTPPAFGQAIRICLAKDPEDRWQSARDLAHALTASGEAGAAAGVAHGEATAAGARSTGRERLLWGAAVALLALALAWAAMKPGGGAIPGPERVTRTYIRPMPGTSFMLTDATGFVLSPDGSRLAYVGSTADGRTALFVRRLDSLTAQMLEGTYGAAYPFWSADSRRIGFFSGAKLRKIDLSGGPPLALCEASDGRGGAWNANDDIIFTPGVNSPIYRVAASGGTPTAITTLDSARNELSNRWPQFLPDGRHFIYLAGSVFTPRENPTNVIRVGSLDGKVNKELVRSHAGAIYASGHLLYMRMDTLLAQPFDLGRLELTGGVSAIADPVPEMAIFSRGLFSASTDGLLAYVEGTSSAGRRLVWYDRSGKQIGALPDPDGYASPRLSPDGRRLLFYLDQSGYDVWTYDFDRGVKAPQTFGSRPGYGNIYPIWSPDGKRIAYGSARDGRYLLFTKEADGSSREDLLLEGNDFYKFPTDWSPDGRRIVFQEGTKGGWQIWILPLDGDRTPVPFSDSNFSQREGMFSPDGRWLAYTSNESGEYRVYIAPYPATGGTWQVSTGGGSSPRWRRDGRELFYVAADNHLMVATVRTTATSVEVGVPQPLFEIRPYGIWGRFDVTADGQRFIAPYEPGDLNKPITLVVNWPADLGR